MDFDEEPQAKTDVERISISVVHNQGKFRSAIPCMPIALAALCCFFNVFIPGSGTFLSALSVLCCADARGGSTLNCMMTNMVAALLQLLTAPIVVGFIWSIIWGVLFIQIAQDDDNEKKNAKRRAKECAGEAV